MAPQPVMDMTMAPKGETALAAPAVPEINLAAMFERLAANPDIPVDKMQAVMDMQRTILADRAKVAFNAAMAAAQKAMRPVAADATNPQTRSRYASYAQLDVKIRPIYADHGFALSFDTAEAPVAETVRVVCLVSHAEGHERTYKVDMPADGKGAKGGDVMTKTHAAGAAMSYGMRYLLKMIFNIAVGEDDTDGNEPVPVRAPEGFAEWLDALESKADEGLPALQAMWKVANEDAQLKRFAAHLIRTEPRTWNFLKTRAAKVGK
jgi:hypothetical protein